MADSVWSLCGLARPGLAQFTLGARDVIRTYWRWSRAAEERERPCWVKARGWVHSAARGTAAEQSELEVEKATDIQYKADGLLREIFSPMWHLKRTPKTEEAIRLTNLNE